MTPVINHSLTLERPLAVFDLETTGINVSKDRIIEISIAKALPNGTTEVYTKKVNPGMAIPKESTKVHGITYNDVKNEPKFIDIAREVEAFLADCDFGGFNILKFDLPMLIEEFDRVGIDFSLEGRKVVDAQKIFHLLEPRNLAAAFKFYCNLELDDFGSGAHSAEADALASLMVIDKQVNKYSGKNFTDNQGVALPVIENNIESLDKFTMKDTVDLMGRFVINDEGKTVFNFGKNKGKCVAEVLESEPGFYDWMMKSDFPKETKNQLAKIKLNMLASRFNKR